MQSPTTSRSTTSTTVSHREVDNTPFDPIWKNPITGSEYGIGHGLCGSRPDFTYNHCGCGPLGIPCADWQNNESRTLEMERETYAQITKYMSDMNYDKFPDRHGKVTDLDNATLQTALAAFNAFPADEEENAGNMTGKIAILNKALDALGYTQTLQCFENKRAGRGGPAFHLDEAIGQLWGGGHTGPSGGFMVYIHCGSVTVDLQTRTLGADYGVSGFGLDARSNAAFASKPSKRFSAASLDNRFVTLRNGTIDLARRKRTGLAIEFTDRWRRVEEQTGARGAAPAVSYYSAPPSFQEYTRNDYLFEHLTVTAFSMAMALRAVIP